MHTESAPRSDRPQPEPSFRERVHAALTDATRRIAPLWPLENFVTVNPFLGVSDLPFAQAATRMARVGGARMTMPRAFYVRALDAGHVTEQDLLEALRDTQLGSERPLSPDTLKTRARTEDPDRGSRVLPTVADAAASVSGHEWPSWVTERVSTWAAGYFDRHQASWASPWRGMGAFEAWRGEACIDRTPELMGLRGFRAWVKQLPSRPDEAAERLVERLGVPEEALELYLHRLLMTVPGWAGYARYLLWERELRGHPDSVLTELAVVRLAWEAGLLDNLRSRAVESVWARSLESLRNAARGPDVDPELAVDVALHAAYERAKQRKGTERLRSALAQEVHSTPRFAGERAAVQAVFCIDVRSEIFRRHLEASTPELETRGFAGFFGFPVEYVRFGESRGGARCPALVPPKYVVHETMRGASAEEESDKRQLRTLRRRTFKAWKSFKLAAVSSFGFVETMGLGYLAKIGSDAFGLTRPVPHPATTGLDRSAQRRLGPELESGTIDGRRTGLSLDDRIATAEGMLRAMSLTENFTRLVALVGHGATTVNNPHASALDCGACGGHAGDANARVAAMVLNDSDVRDGLARRGIPIPDETHFIACRHDTTTDRVTFLDTEDVPDTHRSDLDRLATWMQTAGRNARIERARSFGLETTSDPEGAILERSRDWSQVRPEWGLAGCAAFVAAPRRRTESLDLGGRVFLHYYDWHQDEDHGVLELLMTAPLVVASWISLQYYGSTVDNQTFGSGNKVLHNVLGTLGVLEGHTGDLRPGLPWQSVHDGHRLGHDPIRLSAVIEAPTEAMNAIIRKHDSLRQLLDNGWLHLFSIEPKDRTLRRYVGGGTWRLQAPAPGRDAPEVNRSGPFSRPATVSTSGEV